MLTIRDKIGFGHYGRVYKCTISTDVGSTTELAIKRLFVPKTSNFASSLREMDITRKMNKHSDILGLNTVIFLRKTTVNWPDGDDNIDSDLRQDEIAFLYPLAQCDLMQFFERLEESKEIFIELQATKMITSMLLGLEYIHKNNYIHRDIKPLNILYMGKDEVKICDFGVSCKYHKYEERTPEIGTPYFRAPEMLLGDKNYDMSVDMWALGCTYYYILSEKYIPRLSNDVEIKDYSYNMVRQLQDIIDGLPYTVTTDLKLSRPEPVKSILSSLDFVKKTTEEQFLESMTVKLSDAALTMDFLLSMLSFSPDTRATASKCLEHKYLARYQSTVSISRKLVEPFSETPMVYLKSKTMRDAIKSTVFSLLIESRNESWYKDKSVFTALCMYDSVINILQDKLRSLNPSIWKLYFKACFYITVKYHNSEEFLDLSYEKFPMYDPEVQSVSSARDFEKIILEATEYWVYDMSVYDALTNEEIPTLNATFSLLLFVLDGNHNRLTAPEAFEVWKQDRVANTSSAKQHAKYKELTALEDKSS